MSDHEDEPVRDKDEDEHEDKEDDHDDDDDDDKDNDDDDDKGDDDDDDDDKNDDDDDDDDDDDEDGEGKRKEHAIDGDEPSTPQKVSNILDNLDSNLTTVESIGKDIDQLSEHLSGVFKAFPSSRFNTESSRIQGYEQHSKQEGNSPIGVYGQNNSKFSFTNNSYDSKGAIMVNRSAQYENPDTIGRPGTHSGSVGHAGVIASNLHSANPSGTQQYFKTYDNQGNQPKQFSPESFRAVQEYKQRQLEESKRFQPGYEDTYKADDYNRQGGNAYLKGYNSDQLIDNYYSNIIKKSKYEASEYRTIHDLYKNKPRHIYMETDTRAPEKYGGNKSNQYDQYIKGQVDKAQVQYGNTAPGGYYSQRRYDQGEIDNAINVLMNQASRRKEN